MVASSSRAAFFTSRPSTAGPTFISTMNSTMLMQYEKAKAVERFPTAALTEVPAGRRAAPPE